MQIVRTILWIAILVGVLVFSFGNWDKLVDVRIWPGFVWDTRVPAVVVVSFLLGLLPVWLYHRGVRWRLMRRIQALETATAQMARPAADDRSLADAPAAPAGRPERPDDSVSSVDRPLRP